MNETRARGTTVLVDTNAIIEAHRAGAWRALTGAYPVETVEDCVAETQTGFQRRRAEQMINVNELRASLASVHSVSNLERAEFAVQVRGIALDLGEESLWAHALGARRRLVAVRSRQGKSAMRRPARIPRTACVTRRSAGPCWSSAYGGLEAAIYDEVVGPDAWRDGASGAMTA